MTGGPPDLDIYWHNRLETTVQDPWQAFVTSSPLDMTEYIVRLGNLLKECDGRLQSPVATTYSINVVLFIDISRTDTTPSKKYGI